MILARLEIQNYKQYVGEHRIEPPTQGIVGVIGANGVGKTTLFEAIEWCLYNPREIANDEVPPRGGTGRTAVRVTLEDPRDGVRYVVERTLRRGLANGEVFREDRPEAPIVQGSRQVTAYVAGSLIGLSHRAFVSTFFTRQKELSFFGTLKETDRRREVARLLGFETIRLAQIAIGEERSRAKAEAGSLALQHEEATAGRDFATELTAAEERIAAQEVATAEAETRAADATATYTAARADLDRRRALERQALDLARSVETVAGKELAAAARREGAEEALRRLDEAAATRDALAPVAARADELAAAVAAHVAERDRAGRHAQIVADVARAERARADAARSIRREAAGVRGGADELPAWAWQPADDPDPVGAVRRRVAAVAALDVDTACETAVRLAECRQLAEKRDKALDKVGRYRARQRQLEEERTALLAAGDPEAALAAATRAREGALREASEALTRADAAAANRATYEPLVVSLRARQFGERCPTCARVFSPAEAELTVAALEDHLDVLRDEEARERARRGEATERAAAAQRQEAEQGARLSALTELKGRLAQAAPTIKEAEEDAARAERDCADALAGAGLDGPPTPEAVAKAQARADRSQALANAASLLAKFGDDAERAEAEIEQARRALVALGPVAYDAGAHAAADRDLEQARAAAARIGQIALDLAQRPDREAERAAAVAELAELAEERASLERERATVGFDPGALSTAAAAEAAALAEERAATGAHTDAQNALRAAVGARDAILAEQARLADLARRAETRAREADELDLMYREFTRFDQYVADRVTPALAEHTGELLAAVTDGKYDRVEFDENYGLKIYDEDETFPIEEFSGGERDVAALCARLALSRLVGGQAAHPPAFLVLDEVFGSLDQDRRAHVLETLGMLASSTEAFRQLFIVSHVDEIRSSPIFDEVWRISEVDGVSRFDNAPRVAGLEEL